MKAVREDIALLEQNGITTVALPRLDDPKVIPLWFGEGDRVTPDFIRQVAKMLWMTGKHSMPILEGDPNCVTPFGPTWTICTALPCILTEFPCPALPCCASPSPPRWR